MRNTRSERRCVIRDNSLYSQPTKVGSQQRLPTFRSFICCACLLTLRICGKRFGKGPSMAPRSARRSGRFPIRLLRSGLVPAQDDLEQLMQPAVEIVDEPLLELRAGPPAFGFDGGNVVLADEVAGELALGQDALLAHRLQADSANLNLHRATCWLVRSVKPTSGVQETYLNSQWVFNRVEAIAAIRAGSCPCEACTGHLTDPSRSEGGWSFCRVCQCAWQVTAPDGHEYAATVPSDLHGPRPAAGHIPSR